MTKRIIVFLSFTLFLLAVVTFPAMGKKVADPASGAASNSSNAGTQGSSESNPDGDGVDKPYPADGQPAQSQGEGDWDGNNGCGNDDDREDDNNGWCGKKPTNNNAEGDNSSDKSDNSSGKSDNSSGKSDNSGGSAAAPTASVSGSSVQVLGSTFARIPPRSVGSIGTEVLGVSLVRGESLPATGSDFAVPLSIAAGLIVAGALLLRRRKGQIT